MTDLCYRIWYQLGAESCGMHKETSPGDLAEAVNASQDSKSSESAPLVCLNHAHRSCLRMGLSIRPRYGMPSDRTHPTLTQELERRHGLEFDWWERETDVGGERMGEAHATGLLQQDEPTSWSSSSALTSDTPGPGAAVSDGRQGLSWQNDMEVYYFNGRDGTVRVDGGAFPRGRAGSASRSRGATSHASPTRECRRKEQATWRGWDAGDEEVSCGARVGGLLSSTIEGEVSDLQTAADGLNSTATPGLAGTVAGPGADSNGLLCDGGVRVRPGTSVSRPKTGITFVNVEAGEGQERDGLAVAEHPLPLTPDAPQAPSLCPWLPPSFYVGGGDTHRDAVGRVMVEDGVGRVSKTTPLPLGSAWTWLPSAEAMEAVSAAAAARAAAAKARPYDASTSGLRWRLLGSARPAGGQLLHNTALTRVLESSAGLKWQHIGSTRPPGGQELVHAALGAALRAKHAENMLTTTPVVLREAEWRAFAIAGLRMDHFVVAGSDVFAPLENQTALSPQQWRTVGIAHLRADDYVRVSTRGWSCVGDTAGEDRYYAPAAGAPCACVAVFASLCVDVSLTGAMMGRRQVRTCLRMRGSGTRRWWRGRWRQ